MKNVMDIKKEKALNIILPSDQIIYKTSFRKVVFIIHLHYMESVKEYIPYIKNIPTDIDVIFTVSNQEMYDYIESFVFELLQNCQILMKENRGRDISSFLVRCREIILEYEFVCFLHDKKEKIPQMQNDIQSWTKGMWETMVGSRAYIENVLGIFANRKEIGVLVPPPPLTPNLVFSYADVWYKDFENTKQIAKWLDLNCDLDLEKDPITQGTMFWARVDALRKLFEYEWKYENFDEEPLAADGTISHGVERIFAYVAQDAGYETGWVMTETYAAERIEYTQEVLKKSFQCLYNELGIWRIIELDTYKEDNEDLIRFCNKFEKIYVYGAGFYGKKVIKRLNNNGVSVDSVVVTKMEGNPKFIGNIPVKSIDEINAEESSYGILIAVNSYAKRDQEMVSILKEKGIASEQIFISQ